MNFLLKKNVTLDINKNGNESLGKMNCSRIQDPIELNHIYLVIEEGLDTPSRWAAPSPETSPAAGVERTEVSISFRNPEILHHHDCFISALHLYL